MSDLLTFPTGDEPEIAIEPELELALEPDAEPGIEIESESTIESSGALALLPIAEILPADFRLPILTRFIPNPALRIAADQAAAYALKLTVEGPEGLQRADLALTALRTSLKAIQEHFDEPTAIANDLHKRLTGIRSEWQAVGKAANEQVGRRIYTEQKRLKGIAQEERRKAQEVADRQAREAAQREAAAAEQAKAPAPVVEELKRQAQTATAPPVQTQTAAPVLAGSSTVAKWKARLIGTPGSDEPNPTTADLTPAQRAQVFELLKAILDARAPLVAIDLNWSYLNKRASSDKSTLVIPGIESYEDGSVRAKGSRSK